MSKGKQMKTRHPIRLARYSVQKKLWFVRGNNDSSKIKTDSSLFQTLGHFQFLSSSTSTYFTFHIHNEEIRPSATTAFRTYKSGSISSSRSSEGENNVRLIRLALQ